MDWKCTVRMLQAVLAKLRFGRRTTWRQISDATQASIQLGERSLTEREEKGNTNMRTQETPGISPPGSVPDPFADWYHQLNAVAKQYHTTFSVQQARELYKRFSPRMPAPVPEQEGESEAQG